MQTLVLIFGWPHELLHVLALVLIGRRPAGITRTHVDIPDDLSGRQFVFVAGLPAFVFALLLAVSAWMLLNAGGAVESIMWLGIATLSGLATASTVGDMQLIMLRIFDQSRD